MHFGPWGFFGVVGIVAVDCEPDIPVKYGVFYQEII